MLVLFIQNHIKNNWLKTIMFVDRNWRSTGLWAIEYNELTQFQVSKEYRLSCYNIESMDRRTYLRNTYNHNLRFAFVRGNSIEIFLFNLLGQIVSNYCFKCYSFKLSEELQQ